MKSIFVVTQNSDLNEGRGVNRPVAYFTTYKDAEAFAEVTPGVMGTSMGVRIEKIEVYDYLHEHPKATKEVIKDKALAKLTDYERQILGLR